MSREYRLRDGVTKVADSWADLIDGSLDHSIDRDPRANPIYLGQAAPYTATAANGTYDTSGDCDNWTNVTAGHAGVGDIFAVNAAWTTSSAVQSCSNTDALGTFLYCFQQ